MVKYYQPAGLLEIPHPANYLSYLASVVSTDAAQWPIPGKDARRLTPDAGLQYHTASGVRRRASYGGVIDNQYLLH